MNNYFNIISTLFGLSVEKIKENNKKRVAAYPRQLLIYFLFCYKKMPISEIMRQFPEYNRTAGYNSIKSIESYMKYNKKRMEILKIFLILADDLKTVNEILTKLK